jgi:hypothetical protein
MTDPDPDNPGDPDYHTATLIVETTDGEPVDRATAQAALVALGLKVRRTAAGDHILAGILFDRARENIDLAMRLAHPHRPSLIDARRLVWVWQDLEPVIAAHMTEALAQLFEVDVGVLL